MDLLLVDDNPDYLLLLRDALYSHGYNVETAADGVEACALLSAREFDLIISDIRMPRLDGLRLHAFTREMDRYRSTKFVFISGIREAYKDAVALNPKLDFFLEKTTPLQDIVKFVDSLLFGSFEGAWL